MKFQGNFKQYLKWLLGSYLVIGILLAFNSKLILDFSLSTFVLVGPFVLCTVAYGVLTLNKKYIISGIGVGLLYFVALMDLVQYLCQALIEI